MGISDKGDMRRGWFGIRRINGCLTSLHSLLRIPSSDGLLEAVLPELEDLIQLQYDGDQHTCQWPWRAIWSVYPSDS